MPKLEKDTIQKGEIFKDINELDAICHVVRVFQDDSVYHADGSVDPKRDIDFVNNELILYDMIFIEKRMERLQQKMRVTKDELSTKECELLGKLKAHLDKMLPLRLLEISADDKKLISSYPLVTRKAMMLALNVSESDLKSGALVDRFKKEYADIGLDVMQVSAKVEAEIAAFDSPDDRATFLAELGITEPAINLMTRLCIKTLDLISFFTVGEDEVRQWPIRKGSTAPEAAGAIHTDLQKGFIRAEVMRYDDLVTLGGEDKVKEAGKFSLKGKEYIVTDGDVICIRFNV